MGKLCGRCLPGKGTKYRGLCKMIASCTSHTVSILCRAVQYLIIQVVTMCVSAWFHVTDVRFCFLYRDRYICFDICAVIILSWH